MANVQPNDRPVYRRSDFGRDLVALRPHLVAFGRSLTKNPDYGEELAQETMFKAWKAWESFQPGTSLKAWCFMILRNQFYSEKRRSWRSTPLDQEIAENVRDTSTDPSMHEEVIQQLCAMAPILASLNPLRRDAVIGTRYLGLKYDEVAAILGCAVGTIKSAVSRAAAEINSSLARETQYRYDIEAWATATAKVPKNHPYFPIAKAYEEIYRLVAENSTRKSEQILRVDTLPKPANDIDVLWKELLDSGALDEEESLSFE